MRPTCAPLAGVGVLLVGVLVVVPAAADPDLEGAIDPVEPAEVVDAVWLGDRGARDLREAVLLSTSGLSSDTGLAGGFALSGLAERHWLVVVDDVPLMRTPWGELVPATVLLPLVGAGDVSVQHGPASERAGAGALAGVIEVGDTPRTSPSVAQAAVDLRGGQRLASTTALRVGTSAGSWSADVNAFGGLAQTTGTGAKPGGEVAGVSTSGARARATASLGGGAHVDFAATVFALDRTGLHQQRFLLQLGSGMEFLPAQHLRFCIVRQGVAESGSEGSGAKDAEAGETQVQASYRGELIAGHRVTLALGGLVEEARLERPGQATGARFRAGVGLSAADDWQVRPSLHIIGQARLNLDDSVGPLVGGRIALRYEPTTAVVLRGAVGSSHRVPTLAERGFVDAAIAGIPTLGSTELRAERSQGVRLSAGLEPRADFFCRLTLFRTDLSDLLEPGLVSVAGSAEAPPYRNIGRAHVQGLQLRFLASRLIGGVGLGVGHQWLPDARDDRTGEALPHHLDHATTVRVIWDLAPLRTHFFVDADLFGEQASGSPAGLRPLAVLHAGVRQVLFDVVELTLAVDNAADAVGGPALPVARRTLRGALRLQTGSW